MAASLQTILHENETPGVDGAMRTTIDTVRGILRFEGTGCWSPTQLRDHLAEFGRAVAAFHDRGMSVVVIADLRAADALAPGIITRQKSDSVGHAIHREGDRIALVVSSSLAKMQMRSILKSGAHEFFLSMSAAENWALAYRTDRAD